MFDCLFDRFFELIVGSNFYLLVRFITVWQLSLARLLHCLLLLQFALLVVEVEYEFENRLIFTVLTYALVYLVELAHLRSIW